MSILAFIWFATFLFYFVQTVNPKNIQMFKYHAAEHKALNYWDEYKNVLREPELAEVEVSVQGMSEYIKTMTEESDDV